VAETLIRLARHRAAVALVLAAHGNGTLRELTLSSTTREALHRAPSPVMVIGATG
jgi:nucleotide-binding universal stress UspA family protein